MASANRPTSEGRQQRARGSYARSCTGRKNIGSPLFHLGMVLKSRPEVVGGKMNREEGDASGLRAMESPHWFGACGNQEIV